MVRNYTEDVYGLLTNPSPEVLEDLAGLGQGHPHDQDHVHAHAHVPGRAPAHVPTVDPVQGVAATARNVVLSLNLVPNLVHAPGQDQDQRGLNRDQDPGLAQGLVLIVLPQRRKNHAVAQNLLKQRATLKKKSNQSNWLWIVHCQYNWIIIPFRLK